MIKRKKMQEGSLTIEATLTLTLFMFAFIAIVSLAMIARVECITQYAINQTAKEISQYCYIADRTGMLAGLEGFTTMTKSEQCTVNSADDAVEAIVNLNAIVTNDSQDLAESLKTDDLKGIINSVGTAYTDINNGAENVYDKIKDFAGDNPVAAIKTLVSGMGRQTAKSASSRVVAIAMCKALVPKYITQHTGDADSMLKKLGVEGGLEDLNFGMSTVLLDGRTINVVCVYRVKVMWLFGTGSRYMTVKQTASTAAWIKNVSIADAATEKPDGSLWNQDNYGHAFVAKTKKDNSNAVKSGVGIDLYDESTNTFTEIRSMNVFNKTYANCEGDTGDVNHYILVESKIKSTVKSYANKVNTNTEKIGEQIEMNDGTRKNAAVSDRKKELILYVPEEAKEKTENKAVLDKVAADVEKDTGVKVRIIYEDKAFTTSGSEDS